MQGGLGHFMNEGSQGRRVRVPFWWFQPIALTLEGIGGQQYLLAIIGLVKPHPINPHPTHRQRPQVG